MTRDRGAVLINALVIVLVISSVAAALLTRAEGARVRSAENQSAQQLDLYLDGVEGLLPVLLRSARSDSGVVHPGQAWAKTAFVFDIDRGRVSAGITDLQGRLNVNWLSQPGDAYARETFERLFAAIDLPRGLLDEIAAFVGPTGPRNINAYMDRPQSVQPRGGPVASMQALRIVEGMTAAHFEVLQRYVSALPFDAKLNLNSAEEPVLRAALDPFPSEQTSAFFTDRRKAPLASISDFRQRTIEILETEDVDNLPFDHLSVGSVWFLARLTAVLEDRQKTRLVTIFHDTLNDEPTRVAFRRTVFD
jgi:general secretion pathway protein K